MQDQRQATYRAAFIHDRFLIRRARGDADAITDLEASVQGFEPGRYKAELEAELVSARAKATRS